MAALTADGDSSGVPTGEVTFAPRTAEGPGVIVGSATYYFRAFDSGTSGWVTWSSSGLPNLTPTSTQTTPNYTGTLSRLAIEVIQQPVLS
jgi:hypothetical protein